MHEYENKYRKEPYGLSEMKALKKGNSFITRLMVNLILGIPIFLLCLIFSVFPFLPHSKYGFGAENPSSFSDYIRIVGKGIFAGFIFFILITVITAVIDFIRTKIDLILDYKKVGTFKILKIDGLDKSKVIYLSGGKKLKIDDSDLYFGNIKEEDLIEVQKTATNKLLNLKIVR